MIQIAVKDGKRPVNPGSAKTNRGPTVPDFEIDLERVIYDPQYRRWARDQLNRLTRRPDKPKDE